MNNKLKEVGKYFKDNGCVLLENNYLNAHAKMRYKCVCGSISYINLNNFKSGKRCGCRRKGKITSTEKIKNEVESYGYKFISEELVNGHHVVTCVCKCNNIRTSQLKNIKKSEGCKKCLIERFSFDYNYVCDFFKEKGCILLEKEYINARKKLKYRCVCGNNSEIVFESFKKGNRCKECGIKKNTGQNNFKWIKDRNKKKENDIFRKRCRTMLATTLKSFCLEKIGRTEILLGYNFNELKNHIQNHPNWGKLKNKKWHIDHIFPLQAFVEYSILDIGLANCLENLQPLSQIENISKNCKYDKQKFENWLESKNISFK